MARADRSVEEPGRLGRETRLSSGVTLPPECIPGEGLTPGVRQSLDDALRTRELVKVQFAKNAEVKAKTAANDLARDVEADVVQTIGRTVTLFRLNPELEQKRRAKASEEAP